MSSGRQRATLAGIVACVLTLLVVGMAETWRAPDDGGSLFRTHGEGLDAQSSQAMRTLSEVYRGDLLAGEDVRGVRGSSNSDAGLAPDDGWWQSLPRQRQGWWFATALVDPSILSDASTFVRCVDLNPRDIPLTKSQFQSLSRLSDERGRRVKEDWENRYRMMHEEMIEMIDSGVLVEQRADDLVGVQREVYRSELRLFKKMEGRDEGKSRSERLALVNAIGRTTGGFVHTSSDGKTYAASLGQLPRTELLDRATRDGKGELALWLIGTLVEFGVLDAAEASALLGRTWSKLRLH